MKKILTIMAIIAFAPYSNGMELIYSEQYNWKNIARVTSSEAETTAEAESCTYGGSVPMDLAKIKLTAEVGDPISQYCIGRFFWNKAPALFNGERKKCYEIGAMLFLISAFRGEFWKSKEEISGILSTLELTPTKDTSVETLSDYARQISLHLSK